MHLIEVYRVGLTKIAQRPKVSGNAEDAMLHFCKQQTPRLATGMK